MGFRPQTRARSGFLRSRVPSALNWILLAYALLAITAGCAYTVTKIRSDYRDTLAAERSTLSGTTAILESDTHAMLDDGVGAAMAGARQARARGGLDRLQGAQAAALLQRQLTGGRYVRVLFLSDPSGFVFAGRALARETPEAPGWLAGAHPSGRVWVGPPMHNPLHPSEWVVPVARRTHTGSKTLGWAGALFDFTGFRKLYLKFGDQVSQMGLVSADGIVLADVEKDSRQITPGISLAHDKLFQRAIHSGTADVIEGYGQNSGQDMIYGDMLIEGYPIYVFAGQYRNAVIAGWRARRRQSIAAVAAFSVFVLIMTAFLGHYIRALRVREHDYRTLFNSSKVAVFLLEGDHFVEANRTVATLFGLESEQAAIGLSPWDLSPELQPNGRPSRDAARERIRTAARAGSSTFEWLHKRLDNGETFPAEVDLSTLSTSGTTLALAVVHDLTDRKRSEEELRLLSTELMHYQDEERRRVGRDLHDSTGQTLAALEIGLSHLGQEATRLTPSGRDQLRYCARLAQQCSTEIRTASYLLHPPLLDELGLVSALHWLAEGLRARSGLEVRLSLPDYLDRLAPDEELALFRVAQEALTNVHRHAQSPWVHIRLCEHGGEVVLEIEDGGRGIGRVEFPAGAALPQGPTGVGVAGMRERIRQFGGAFTVESPVGGGTLIRAILPRTPPSVMKPKPVAQAS